MDTRLAAAPVVLDLARALDGVLVGLYVGGSLATGDYHPGISDIDAVALLDRSPTLATRAMLIETHGRLVRDAEGGSALHCVYVPDDDTVDPAHKHWTWAFGELYRRPLSGIARAELLADPVVVVGPPPSDWLPPMDVVDIAEAARAELAGYWTQALRKQAIWLQDLYVDLGLMVLARADATIREGRLITKAEALGRMATLGVPASLVAEVAQRRNGEQVDLDDGQRQRRAAYVRQFLTGEVARLLTASVRSASE
ncbi:MULTISPECIES: nucleotidyltransferase domain-containing protein [Mumia]|uniref:nucleotidyltransferase domain-containing protein n=1 Tax=Mumia TaxID=1546255 RepID=UPI00141F8B51|nr:MULTISPECIES: nucleotidyltransferase domain-containing protein [unclassified Mumia]QMW65394.1 nucleotidyltransferase domain-containing protein [Mumia sp. ZJ1417]